MTPKKVYALATWSCEHGDKEVAGLIEYGRDAWPPPGLNWCQDEAGDHLLCDTHYREWLAEVERKNPGLPWTA